MARPILPDTPERELQLIDDLLLEWRARERTKANARVTVARLARWLDARGSSLAQATTKDCLEWMAQRRNEVSQSTLAKNWSELRAFYRLAADDIDDPLQGRASPMARIKMPHYPKWAKTHAATVDEVDAVIRSFDRRTATGLRNAAMVSLMFRSGLRVGEVAGLDYGHYDPDKRTLHLGITKNLEPRTVRVHDETLHYLGRYLRRRGDRPGPLFVNEGRRRSSDRLPVGAIQTVIKRAVDKAGVTVTPHSLRRGFTVEYIAHGGDTATLMILGGWTSETMIVRYLADQRASTAHTVFDAVAARQLAARSRTSLRAVQ